VHDHSLEERRNKGIERGDDNNKKRASEMGAGIVAGLGGC
jgi:hypothetical protein